MLDAIKHIIDDIFSFGKTAHSAALVHMHCTRKTVQLLRWSRLPFSWTLPPKAPTWTHLSVCLSVPRRIPTILHGPGYNLDKTVSNFAKNFGTDLHEIFSYDWQWANGQMIKFWWRFGLQIRIRVATVVRRVLAEGCIVPVLLVTLFTYAVHT